ncbi:hypothetical protein Tco_1452124, partial [Tanacetum coccineum]
GINKVDPLNPLPPASESEPKDAIEVENPIEHEDETVPDSVHEVGESSTAPFHREDSDGLLPGLMRRDINSLFGRMASLSRRLRGRETAHALVEKKGKAKDEYYGKLILDLGNEVRSSVEQGTAAMEKLVKKLDNAKDKVECKKLKKELKKQVTKLSPQIMPPKSAPMTQAVIRRLIKENVNDDIAVEQARHANVGNDAMGFRPVRGAAELQRWFKKIKSVFGISDCVEGTKVRFNELALICLRMVEPERVKFDAYTQGLTDNIKGEVTSSKLANLSEAVRMAHKLMDQKSQARDERILERKKRKLPLCERCFTHHVGQCLIKYHKCGKVGHKSRYCKEKNVATCANALPIPTCYDYGEQGHNRNRCPRKVKQEEVGEVLIGVLWILEGEVL